MREIQYESFDDALGNAQVRFFGSGYLKVSQEVTNISVRVTDNVCQVAATGSLYYPGDWAQKETVTDIVPHLSSLDMLVLSCTAVEIAIVHAHGLTAEQLSRAWVARVDVKAGSAPTIALRAIPIAGSRVRCLPHSASTQLSTFALRIGNAKVELDIVYEVGVRASLEGRYRSSADRLGPESQRLYGSAYKQASTLTTNIRLEPERAIELADHVVLPANPSIGTDAAYAPSMSFFDAVIACAQLAQVLVYEIDGVIRARSNQFWLRRMTLVAGRPDRPGAVRLTSRVVAERLQLIERGGRTMRSMDVNIEFGEISVSASVAHELASDARRQIVPGRTR